MTPEDEARRRLAAARERAEWAELQHVYERCIVIAARLWDDQLDKAAAQQQALAEQMRDRRGTGVVGGFSYETHPLEIPVPLFTPRDRMQFIKEVAATILISADRRNLTVQYPKERVDAAPEPQAPQQPGLEAASGADESTVDAATPSGLA